jgi:molybdopterin-guanine dinucleotide biosynthesis protein B
MKRLENRIFGLAGWSGSGKTMLVARLLPELIGRGLRVSTVKHAHANFDLAEGKESDIRLRNAGAVDTMFATDERWALLHEGDEADGPTLDELVARFSPVDLILIEGFKEHRHAKLEVYRPSNGKPLLATADPHIVAIASDGAVPPVIRDGKEIPLFDMNDVRRIGDFIVDHCGLPSARGS